MNMYPIQDPQDSSSSTPSPPLQRGKACLSCRRRKMKCDGGRPVCTPCLRGERVEDCEYTDGPHRPRTLTLEEDIARLRARVQELENPEGSAPSVELYTPYATGAGAGSSSAMGSSAQARIQAPSPASYRPAGMRQGPVHGPPGGGVTEPRRGDYEADVRLHARRALSVIAPYTAELGFFLNLDRLRVQGSHILPALQSALTLWSVHIASTAESDHASAHETGLGSTLLLQTQTQFASALSTVDAEPDPAIFLHVIQTGVLLAYYMQRIGQAVGARYYASGTWALVMTMRLYRGPRREGARWSPEHTDAHMRVFAFAGSAGLAPALDGIEAEERVRAFWAVYTLDRWFSAACEGPCRSLAMDGSAGNAMTVPWPSDGEMESGARSNVVQHLLNDPSHDFARDGALAMHAKASVLLGEAMGIAASFAADHTVSQSSAFRARFGTLDVLLQRCLGAAMTMAATSQGYPSRTQEQAHALVSVHIIALAHVTLHRPFVSTYAPSRRRCVEGTLGVVRVLDQLGEVGPGTGGISPIYPIVWTALCLALHDELARLRARPDAEPAARRAEMVGAIRKLVGILSALSQRCPSRFFAANIEALLPVLESIAA